MAGGNEIEPSREYGLDYLRLTAQNANVFRITDCFGILWIARVLAGSFGM